jgi:hypothetical protein
MLSEPVRLCLAGFRLPSVDSTCCGVLGQSGIPIETVLGEGFIQLRQRSFQSAIEAETAIIPGGRHYRIIPKYWLLGTNR